MDNAQAKILSRLDEFLKWQEKKQKTLCATKSQEQEILELEKVVLELQNYGAKTQKDTNANETAVSQENENKATKQNADLYAEDTTDAGDIEDVADNEEFSDNSYDGDGTESEAELDVEGSDVDVQPIDELRVPPVLLPKKSILRNAITNGVPVEQQTATATATGTGTGTGTGTATAAVTFVQQKPKRPFLKRGEGLKQRFKIDPEALRINNLPHYKYQNAHGTGRLKKTNSNNNLQKPKVVKSTKLLKISGNNNLLPVQTELDIQERCFQKLLISSQNAFNSTPDIKFMQKTDSQLSSKNNFNEFELDKNGNDTTSSDKQTELPLTWAKVLDNRHITPLPVYKIHANLEENGDVLAQFDYDEDLSIFELLEKKANDGVGLMDMNSNCIRQFIARKNNEQLNESSNDDIPVNTSLISTKLLPQPAEMIENSNQQTNDTEITSDEGSTYFSINKTSNAQNASMEEDDDVVEEDEMEDDNDSISSNSTMTKDANSTQENEIFLQIKAALFEALQSRAEKVENEEAANKMNKIKEKCTQTPTNSPTKELANELKNKVDLVKIRLCELDKEISMFKENNLQLIKAKQEFEMEKVEFIKERNKAMDRIKDEKIEMEMYLHDERMKIDEDKRTFEQKIHLQKSRGKERREIARLKGEVDELQIQMKQKEHNHIAAQSRLRTQIRNFEKDQKQLQEDIEHLKNENKRLLNENAKIMREKNNRMLNEINRNISKLAPKLVETNLSQDHIDLHTKKPTTANALLAKNKTTQRMQPVPLPRRNHLNKAASVDKKNSKKSISSSVSVEDDIMFYNEFNECSETEKNEDDEEFNAVCVGNNVRNVGAGAGAVRNGNSDGNGGGGGDVPRGSKISIDKSTQCPSNKNNLHKSSSDGDFKREVINSDGSRDIWYPNGNFKKISADGMKIRMLYFNKDIKETDINDGTIKYYYAETNTWHTTYLDGLEILEFPNGQVEHRYKNGVVEIHFPNSSIKITNPVDENLVEEWRYPDGSNLMQMANGDRILTLPNGQKEIHTKAYKQREYPDGTVKTVYPDGSQETRYSNGRVRFKDKDGTLIMDMQNGQC